MRNSILLALCLLCAFAGCKSFSEKAPLAEPIVINGAATAEGWSGAITVNIPPEFIPYGLEAVWSSGLYHKDHPLRRQQTLDTSKSPCRYDLVLEANSPPREEFVTFELTVDYESGRKRFYETARVQY